MGGVKFPLHLISSNAPFTMWFNCWSKVYFPPLLLGWVGNIAGSISKTSTDLSHQIANQASPRRLHKEILRRVVYAATPNRTIKPTPSTDWFTIRAYVWRARNQSLAYYSWSTTRSSVLQSGGSSARGVYVEVEVVEVEVLGVIISSVIPTTTTTPAIATSLVVK